jgi:ribosomal protein L34E
VTITCGKVRFLTEGDAKAALVDIVMRRNQIESWHPVKKKMPRRAYQCPECLGWHLTSQVRVDR